MLVISLVSWCCHYQLVILRIPTHITGNPVLLWQLLWLATSGSFVWDSYSHKRSPGPCDQDKLWEGRKQEKANMANGYPIRWRGTAKEGSLMGAVLEGSLACWVARPLAIHQPGKMLPLFTWIIPPPPPPPHQQRWLSGPNQATDREQFCESERGATLPITVSCASSTGPPTNQPTVHPSFHHNQVGWVKQK